MVAGDYPAVRGTRRRRSHRGSMPELGHHHCSCARLRLRRPGQRVRQRPAGPPQWSAGRSLQSRDKPGTPPPDHRCPAHPAPAPASPHQRPHPHMYSPHLGEPLPALPRRHAHACAGWPTISRSRRRTRYRHPSQRRGSLRALGKRPHRRRDCLPPAQPCRAGRSHRTAAHHLCGNSSILQHLDRAGPRRPPNYGYRLEYATRIRSTPRR